MFDMMASVIDLVVGIANHFANEAKTFSGHEPSLVVVMVAFLAMIIVGTWALAST